MYVPRCNARLTGENHDRLQDKVRPAASHRTENHLKIEISPALSCVDRVGDIVFVSGR